MPKTQGSTTTVVIMSLGAVVAGCQSAPARYADTGVHATYQVATTGASAVRATGGQLYQGAGRAIRTPLHDLNMMQDKIAPVLLRAETRPYDLNGVNSCSDVLNRVSELDLALGPDVDTPKPSHRTRVARGADFAASTALDAAGSAAEHFIPMRGTIKQLTGATRYENHVKHAELAGETRRSFLKAIGMEHNCTWPAAPLDFKPVQVADISTPWNAPAPPAQAAGGAVMLAAAAPRPAAAPAATSGPRAPTGQKGVAQVASLTGGRALSQVVLVSSAPAPRTPVIVAVHERLAIPDAMTASADPSQSWRPAQAAGVVEVSAPMSNATLATAGGAAAAAPWSAASFATTSAVRP